MRCVVQDLIGDNVIQAEGAVSIAFHAAFPYKWILYYPHMDGMCMMCTTVAQGMGVCVFDQPVRQMVVKVVSDSPRYEVVDESKEAPPKLKASLFVLSLFCVRVRVWFVL